MILPDKRRGIVRDKDFNRRDGSLTPKSTGFYIYTPMSIILALKAVAVERLTALAKLTCTRRN